jgi:hypothetical protein
MTKRFIQAFVLLALVGGITACGSKGAGAKAELDTIDAIMQQAVSDGADEFAPVELRFAREKQRQASVAMKEKKYSKASMLSREAKVDAQLAGALAMAVKSRNALEEVNKDLEMRPAGLGRNTAVSATDSLRALIGAE